MRRIKALALIAATLAALVAIGEHVSQWQRERAWRQGIVNLAAGWLACWDRAG
jgi:hypothetical protein